MGEQVTTQAHLTIVDTNDIESITVEYARNQSTSTPPDANTGGWSTTRPNWAQGYYIWQRTRIHKTGTAASADTFGAAVCLTGSTGTNSYTHVRYGTSSSGAGMTATPTTSTTYIGIYTGTSSTAPTSASSYTWTKFVGDPGRKYITLVNGDDLNSKIAKDTVYVSTSTAVCSSLLNKPEGFISGECRLEVEWCGSDNYLIQRLYCKNASTSKNFYRTYNSGTFGSWIENKGAKGDTGPVGPTGPEAVVTITPTTINWEAGTATLAVTLRVNGVVTTPLTYNWTKGANTNSLGTSSTLTLNGSTNKLDSTYNCTVTW